MTEEKWIKILKEESMKTAYYGVTPENWNDEYRKIVLNFVKTMDEATEVYNMENKEN